MIGRSGAAAVALILSLSAVAPGRTQGDQPVTVEPAELERRRDLVGREVIVDDRVAYYVPRPGTEDDELQLKRTPITFRVPHRLRPPAHTRMPSAVVRGVLEREGSRLSCRVLALEVKAADLDRLKAAVDQLSPRDYETRRAWARWAERRAAAFRDEHLMKRARSLEAEALRLEGDTKRVAVDAPQEWLEMAREARRRNVPEPEPSALAHRAIRARLATAAGAADLRDLAKEVDALFPRAAADKEAARTRLGRLEAEYADDPASAYRSAPPEARKALDRRLWADVQARLIEGRPVPDLTTALNLADQAADRLPERTDLANRLVEAGVAASRRGLSGLRLDEVRRLADVYRDRLRRPDEARQVLRDWLDDRRSRLSRTDAEGRVELANRYEELAQDRATSIELLRKASEIDPNSERVAEAFRTRNFVRRKDGWVEADPTPTAGPPGDQSPPGRPGPATSQSLLGLTPDELERRLIARPTFKNHVAAKGQLIEQRVYLDTDSVRYVNLLRTPGESRPRVIADYTLPRRDRKGGPIPSR